MNQSRDGHFIVIDDALFYWLLPQAAEVGMSVNELIDWKLADSKDASGYFLSTGGLGNLNMRPGSTKSVRVTENLYRRLRTIQRVFKMSSVAVDLTSILSYNIITQTNDWKVPNKLMTNRDWPSYYGPRYCIEEQSGKIVIFKNSSDWRWVETDWESVVAWNSRR